MALTLANGKYQTSLTVTADQTFFCPKTGISKKFSELTEADCQKMIDKGVKHISKTVSTPAAKP